MLIDIPLGIVTVSPGITVSSVSRQALISSAAEPSVAYPGKGILLPIRGFTILVSISRCFM
jgi:hypothetical protein